MYYYIYDTFLDDKKYERVIDRIKTRLLDLDIQGKHEKLTLLKNVDELVSDEVKKGAKNIIVVGNDKLFLKVVNVVAQNNVTLGIVPIGPGNNIAKCLGVPIEEAACDVLAARQIMKFDLGKIKGMYFWSNLAIVQNLTRLTVEKDSYKIIPGGECSEVKIYNFYYPKDNEPAEPKLKLNSGQDQQLELVIKSKVKRKGWFRKAGPSAVIDTIIQGNKFAIKSFEYLPVLLDDFRVIKTPVSVEVEPKKFNVIVGKERQANIN